MQKSSSNTFEMFWNCSHCGTKKLLGITHRHCPNCGAAQDESKRYFPPDGEEIALHNHIYYGVDWDCQYCSTPNSKKSNNCVNCGGPKEGSFEVNLIDSNNKIIQNNKKVITQTSSSASKPITQNTPNSIYTSNNEAIKTQQLKHTKNNNNSHLFIGFAVLIFVFFIGFLIYGFNHITPSEGTVVHKSWERTTSIEEYRAISDNDWCSSIPSDSYNISKKREVRSYEKVKTGEVCKTVKHDNGDGSFSKDRYCENTYKSVPVYDKMCYYYVNRWRFSHNLKSNGSDDLAPHWPSLSNEFLNEGNNLGNQRARQSSERYSVIFSYLDEQIQKEVSCNYSQTSWNSFEKNRHHTINIRMIGGADCP